MNDEHDEMITTGAHRLSENEIAFANLLVGDEEKERTTGARIVEYHDVDPQYVPIDDNNDEDEKDNKQRMFYKQNVVNGKCLHGHNLQQKIIVKDDDDEQVSALKSYRGWAWGDFRAVCD